jgi:hypothetical protein
LQAGCNQTMVQRDFPALGQADSRHILALFEAQERRRIPGWLPRPRTLKRWN